jgi:RNA polymerase sigma-70 factor (ECF subfamily)
MPPATQAIEELIERYGKLVFHVIYGLTGCWEESQDLTQETFLQALKAIDAARAGRGECFQAKAWLLRIATNTVRMHWRRQRRARIVLFSELQAERYALGSREQAEEPPAAALEEIQGADDPGTLIAERDMVQRCLTHLPATLRLPLFLTIVAGFSTREVAHMLDLREVTVRQRLTRARKLFQRLYLQESGETLCETGRPAQRTHSVIRLRGHPRHRSAASTPAVLSAQARAATPGPTTRKDREEYAYA